VRHSSILISLLVASTLSACTSRLDLKQRPCPCAEGWSCCADQNVCVAPDTPCPDELAGEILVVTPDRAELRLGGTLQLSASGPVSWSVQEAGGGSIDERGFYRAPLIPGTYHVLATPRPRYLGGSSDGGLVDDAQKTTSPEAPAVRVVVTVGPTRLEVYAGQIGGMGNADGIGEQARFHHPIALCGDGKGTLYVLDAQADLGLGGRHVAVRSVDLESGLVKTLGRTTAVNSAAAHLLHDQDALYFVSHDTVWKFDLKSRKEHLIAGELPSSSRAGRPWRDGASADAIFSDIRGLVFDGLGNLVVADNFVLRQVDLTTGRVTTIAGELAGKPAERRDGLGLKARFAHINGIARVGNQIMICDGKARLFDLESNAVTTLDFPCSWTKFRIQRSATNLSGRDDEGWFVFVSTEQSVELYWIALDRPKLEPAFVARAGAAQEAGDRDSFGSLARFSQIRSLWLDSGFAGKRAFVVDREKVRQVTYRDGLFVSTVAGKNGARTGVSEGALPSVLLVAPRHMRTGKGPLSGQVYLATGGVFYRFDTEQQKGTIDDPFGSFADFALDNEGYLYISAPFSHIIGRRDPNGAWDVSSFLGDYYKKQGCRDGFGFGVGFTQPAGLASDGELYLYIADTGCNRVFRAEVTTQQVVTVASDLDEPTDVALDGKGGLFVAEKQAIKRVDLKSKTVASLLTAADGLESVTAIAFDPAGVLYIADAGDHRVRGLVIETKETFDLVGQSGQGGVKVGPLPGRVNEPSGVAVLPSGAVLISSAAENAVLIAR
jgi:hypothetical protein